MTLSHSRKSYTQHQSFISTAETAAGATDGHKNDLVFPELVVFDLDDCMWSPEMFTLSELPHEVVTGHLGDKGEGVVAVWSGREQIKLFPGALKVLQEFYLDRYPSTMRIAAASTASNPLAVRIARKSMNMLEVLPGVTMRQVFAKGWEDPEFEGNLQIGRTPPLSSDKSKTHFPAIKAATGIEYNKMLFFDDCNWWDHCAMVEKNCPGVVTQRTPHGLQIKEFINALQKYKETYK